MNNLATRTTLLRVTSSFTSVKHRSRHPGTIVTLITRANDPICPQPISCVSRALIMACHFMFAGSIGRHSAVVGAVFPHPSGGTLSPMMVTGRGSSTGSTNKSKTRRMPANGRLVVRTRSLPTNSAPKTKHNKTGIAATAFIASLAEESARPVSMCMDNRGPVQVLRVGSDCSGIGRALGSPKCMPRSFPTSCASALSLRFVLR